jgi:hypothetical protein
MHCVRATVAAEDVLQGMESVREMPDNVSVPTGIHRESLDLLEWKAVSGCAPHFALPETRQFKTLQRDSHWCSISFMW